MKKNGAIAQQVERRTENPQVTGSIPVSTTVEINEEITDGYMYWTLELASKLEDAPWPATKDELIDYAVRSGAPMEVVENLKEIEDDEEIFEAIEDLWPDYPSKEDFFFHEDEY